MISFLLKLWHGDQQAHHQFDMWMNGLGEFPEPWTPGPAQKKLLNDIDQLTREIEFANLQARLQSCREWREGRPFWKRGEEATHCRVPDGLVIIPQRTGD